MKLHLSRGTPKAVSTLVIYATKDPKTNQALTAKLSSDVHKWFEYAKQDAQFKGDKKELVFFRRASVLGFENLLFVGLGEDKKIDGEALRTAAAYTMQSLKAQKITSVAILGECLGRAMKDSALALKALAEGFGLSHYEYTELKSKPSEDKKPKEKLTQAQVFFATEPTQAMRKALAQAEILVDCQNFARRLGDTPGNLMTPSILANEAVKAAKGSPLKVTVWDKKRIEKERMGGLLAVAQGSSQEPRFIVMEYNGAKASQKPICFVGKGLTFDTGGISIKPSQSMEEMKYDMCGGAAVIATLLAIAKLKLKVNVLGLVPSTENMPGPNAWKPGDVYIARNGKSVEVYNTDAEGRLILGEALVYGSEKKPALMVDAATLTGAIVIALGNTHTGVFTRDKKLMEQIQSAADRAGELVWPMPLTDFHVEDTKGTHADLCNISPGRMAGSSTAAAFLEEFVGPDIPWAHFDIAGTAWNVANRFPYTPKKGASGIIVRTFVELAEKFSSRN